MNKKPNPLGSGLDNVLSSFTGQKPVEPPSPAPPVDAPETPPPARKAAQAPRPPDAPVKGKKSNAEYFPTTVFMRKSIHKRIKRYLEDSDSKMDVSDLIEMLFVDYLKDRNA